MYGLELLLYRTLHCHILAGHVKILDDSFIPITPVERHNACVVAERRSPSVPNLTVHHGCEQQSTILVGQYLHEVHAVRYRSGSAAYHVPYIFECGPHTTLLFLSCAFLVGLTLVSPSSPANALQSRSWSAQRSPSTHARLVTFAGFEQFSYYRQTAHD